MDTETHTLTRRRFLHYTGALGVLAGLQSIVPAYAWPGTAAAASAATRQGAHVIDLLIGVPAVTEQKTTLLLSTALTASLR